MTRNAVFAALALLALDYASPSCAGIYKLIPADEAVAVAKSGMTVTPSQDWNHLGPRVGRNAESWTLDGLTLNDVTFYGGIAADQTLFKERDKKDKPLPRFSATMLAPDVVQMFEESYRIANDTTLFKIDGVAPEKFMGGDGFRFTYTFTSTDEVERRGEADGVVIAGKLYMMTLEAPAIYYFDTVLPPYHKLVDSGALK